MPLRQAGDSNGGKGGSGGASSAFLAYHFSITKMHRRFLRSLQTGANFRFFFDKNNLAKVFDPSAARNLRITIIPSRPNR